jgi:hypothetical protein
MIDVFIPRKYSKVIMEDFDVFCEHVQNVNALYQGVNDLQMTSITYWRMKDISISFADIVGFTHMS